ncbi:hypothetical protein WA577_005743, partial [Blastocystis sp. JDR]
MDVTAPSDLYERSNRIITCRENHRTDAGTGCSVSLTIIENGIETSDYEICPSFADKMGSILSNYRVKMNETDSIVDMTMSTFRDCSHRNCSFALLGCAGAPNSCLIHCTTEDAFRQRSLSSVFQTMLQYTVSNLESIKSIRLYVNSIHNAKEIDLLAGD